MEIFSALAEFGPYACIVAALLYQNFYWQKRVIDIVQNNTKAMEELRATIEAVLKARD